MFPDKETVEEVKRDYPKGCRVKLVWMGDFWAPPVGTEGTVTSVDDVGTVHIRWDDGSGLGATLEDVIRRID